MLRFPFWRRWLPSRSVSPHADPVASAYRELRPGLAARVRYLLDPVRPPRAPDLDPDVIDLAHDYPHLEIRTAPVTRSAEWHDRAGLPELREAVAEGLQRRHAMPWTADRVRIVPGGIAPLARFLDLFLDPGDAVVAFEPDCAEFASSVRARGGVVHGVPARIVDGEIHFDVEALIRAAREARLLLLSHPNTPSGATFAAEDVEQLLFWAEKFDLRIYLDDTFGDFHAGSNPAKLANLPRAAGRVTLGGCLGRSLGRPGLDCGWLAGSPGVIALAGAAQEVAGGSVSPSLQRAALSALKAFPDSLVHLQEELDERREYVFDRLRLCGLTPRPGRGGIFVLAELPESLDGKTLVDALRLGRRVRVANGRDFGTGKTETIRINVSGDERQLREGLTRLLEVTHELLHADRVGQIDPPDESRVDEDCVEPVASGRSDSVE